MEINSEKEFQKKTETRIRWDLNPGPLFFAYNGLNTEIQPGLEVKRRHVSIV